ncbi:MAG: lysozyme [Anaerotignaceae bacterium]
MTLNKAGADLIKSFEGCKLKAYQCSAMKWTIGYGNTFYEDGKPVKMGDAITQEKAEQLFELISADFSTKVAKLVPSHITPNQFGALTSFAYNCGVVNLQKSTLLKKVNANPNDPTIRTEFLKWNKAGGKVLAGLTRRREAEANLYFK